MNRRAFLALLAAIPGLRFLKPKPEKPRLFEWETQPGCFMYEIWDPGSDGRTAYQQWLQSPDGTLTLVREEYGPRCPIVKVDLAPRIDHEAPWLPQREP